MILVEHDVVVVHQLLQIVGLVLHDDEHWLKWVLVANWDDVENFVGEHILFYLGQFSQNGQLPYNIPRICVILEDVLKDLDGVLLLGDSMFGPVYGAISAGAKELLQLVVFEDVHPDVVNAVLWALHFLKF